MNYRQALAKLKRIQFGIVVQERESGEFIVIRCKGDRDIEKVTEETVVRGSIVAVKSGSEMYIELGAAEDPDNNKKEQDV